MAVWPHIQKLQHFCRDAGILPAGPFQAMLEGKFKLDDRYIAEYIGKDYVTENVKAMNSPVVTSLVGESREVQTTPTSTLSYLWKWGKADPYSPEYSFWRALIRNTIESLLYVCLAYLSLHIYMTYFDQTRSTEKLPPNSGGDVVYPDNVLDF